MATTTTRPRRIKDTQQGQSKESSSVPVSRQKQTSIWFLFKVGLTLLILFFLCSYMVTETWCWGVRTQYTNLEHWRQIFVPYPYYQRRPLNLTEAELRQYDGSDLQMPVYLAIDSDVYDVSAGRRLYGKGGSYAFFSGVDAARAYVTGCFHQDLTHDLRGLAKDKLAELANWKKFYRTHPKYVWVGKVWHPPIDPDSPVPPPCKEQYV